MKGIKFYFAIFFMYFSTSIFALSLNGSGLDSLEISDTKWVYLKFNSDIKYADMGTEEILIEKCTIPSVLRIKSLIPYFDKTSITVITMDGVVHTYRLNYGEEISAIAFQVEEERIEIPAFKIELSHKQTSHLIFDKRVVDVGVGLDTIIAESAEGIENIIKCKSVSYGFDFFNETSLTVLTEDGTLFPFLVSYMESPLIVNYNISDENQVEAIFSDHSLKEPEMKKLAKKVLSAGTQLRNLGAMENKMVFGLRSIFVYEDVMMFLVDVQNNSQVDYEIDFIRSYVINKRTSKKQAFQTDEKTPVYTYTENNSEKISAKESYSVVFFFKRFTIPDKHNLFFELFEKNGGRHIKFTVPNKVLLKAKYINS